MQWRIMARIEGPFFSALRWCCGSWRCRCRLKRYTVNTRRYACQQQARFISELSDASVLLHYVMSPMTYLIRDDPARDEEESVRVVSQKVRTSQVNDNHHGVFVRAYREGLCYHRCRYHCGALHRENESRRGQDQNSQSSPSNGLLWRVRFVHVHAPPALPKKTEKNIDFFTPHPASIDPVQATRSSSQNSSSETSDSTISATSTHCAHNPPHRGYAAHWQSRCARARPTRSTSSSADMTRRTSRRTCTGSTISALWPRCLLPPMDMEAISHLVY